MMARIIEEAKRASGNFAASVSGATESCGNRRGAGVPRLARIAHEVIAVFTHKRIHRAAGVTLPAARAIVAFSPEAETRRRMALVLGRGAEHIQDVQKVDGLAKVAEKRLLEGRLVRKGDVIGLWRAPRWASRYNELHEIPHHRRAGVRKSSVISFG